jgi:hypothetical protein
MPVCQERMDCQRSKLHSKRDPRGRRVSKEKSEAGRKDSRFGKEGFRRVPTRSRLSLPAAIDGPAVSWVQGFLERRRRQLRPSPLDS